MLCFLLSIQTQILGQSSLQLFKSELVKDNSLVSEDLIITDDYTSRGIRHIYGKRAINNLVVYNSYGAVHLKNGLSIASQSTLLPNLNSENISNQIGLSALQAVERIAANLGKDGVEISVSTQAIQTDKLFIFEAPTLAFDEIKVELMLFMMEKADLRYVWSVQIDEISTGKWKNYFIDASTGETLHLDNWTVECSHSHEDNCKHKHEIDNLKSSTLNRANSIMTDSTYNVFAYPVESPSHGSRTMEERPWLDNLVASPNGWHTIAGTDYTTTRGNNVDAYLDSNNTNSPSNGDDDRADGGASMQFDFAWDDTTPPADLPLPAITNLFYWNNVTHDVWYNYGFDEASGNFQEENNNGMGGIGSDYVRAEAQDGSGACNANMSTPPDGLNSRMQMYLCNSRDGDLDNAVIVHEYGHGISIRLTGGPSASGCLGNQEQMGEGWSDWFGLMMTIEEGDAAMDNRPIGTYLFNQDPTGPGIRQYPYTTDMAVNPMTYASSFSGVSVPHGVGSVWCTMLWDLSWAMIDEYGFDPDLYNGTGGNNKAMELVIEGLKLQPCSPGFVDGRDAIIAADEAINGGANVCMIWEVFANRGLGYSASQGTSNSRSDGSEAFDMPPSCTLELLKTASVNEVAAGGQIFYTLVTTNNFTEDQTNLVVSDPIPAQTTFVIADNGGSESGGIVTWPSQSLAIDQSVSYTFRVSVDNDIDPVVDDVFDDMESGTLNWAVQNFGSTAWELQSDEVYSGTQAWKAVDGSSPGTAILEYAFDLGIGNSSQLVFTHFYDTEAAWDGGLVEISIDGGSSWIDLVDDFTSNGYNSTIFNSKPGFSGNSGGFITSTVDLSAYDGNVVRVRFLMNCDQFVGGNGWYIDDVFIENLERYIPNVATATTDQFTATGRLTGPTKVLVGPDDFVVESTHSNASCFGVMDGSATVTSMGGSGSYTYLWSSGGVMATESGLGAGSYYCDVSDGILVRRKYFFITEPTEIITTITIDPAIGGEGGSINANVAGGAGSYMYLWSNGETTSTIENLAPGTYTLTVTDGDLCTDVLSIELNDLVDDCDDRAFIIEVQLDQSAQEFSYAVIDDMDNVVNTKSFTVADNATLYRDVICLPDGCYTLRLVDSFGDGLCAEYSDPMGYAKFIDYVSDVTLADECDITVYEKQFCVGPLTATLESTYPSCIGEADGSISITPSAGEYNYSYLWSNGTTEPTADQLLAGAYSVTVSDGINEVILSENLINGNSRVFTTDNDGIGSLRAALTNGCAMDTITFDAGLIGDTIYLTNEIIIDKTAHIEGMTIYGTFISGSESNILFNTTSDAILSLRNMRLIDGSALIDGGAIYNQGQLILEAMALDGNEENGIPRAISGEGSVLIKGSVRIE